MTTRHPRVTIARPYGFCFGVERAIRLARAGKKRTGQAYTLGELVHNPKVLADLAREGIRVVRRPTEAKDGPLVIRAHGCPPATLAECQRLGLEVIDATCPYVRKVQNVARRLQAEGYAVIVVGERNHPEVRSILGYCQGAGRVYSPRLRLPAGRVGVVAQTTMSREGLAEAVANLAQLRYTELRVFDTICAAVVARQRAAARVARNADLVIVVGGRSSANTARLAEIARRAGCAVALVEQAQELRRLPALRNRRPAVVGIVAGSSTPAQVVEEIASLVRNPC